MSSLSQRQNQITDIPLVTAVMASEAPFARTMLEAPVRAVMPVPKARVIESAPLPPVTVVVAVALLAVNVIVSARVPHLLAVLPVLSSFTEIVNVASVSPPA